MLSILLLIGMLFGYLQPGNVTAISPQAAAAQSEATSKVEGLVFKELETDGQTDFFVWLKEKADLSPAKTMKTKLEKGTFVFNTLRDTAARTQADLRASLDAQGISYKAFYIANKILVKGGQSDLRTTLAARADVEKITANHKFQLQEPFKNPDAPAKVTAIETNIIFVKAPDVWALGVTGNDMMYCSKCDLLSEYALFLKVCASVTC